MIIIFGMVLVLLGVLLIMSFENKWQWFGFAITILGFAGIIFGMIVYDNSLSKNDYQKLEIEKYELEILYYAAEDSQSKLFYSYKIYDLNKRINNYREKNKSWIFDPFIDDRINTLEIIIISNP